MAITRVSHRKHDGRGFTLIEVLVVVAIIALLISILLPSLNQARQLSRLTVCITHQKNIGNVMQMYWGDNKDVMPGPIHPMFLKYPHNMKDPSLTEEQNKFVVRGYLNTLLRKYMGDRTQGNGSNMKDIGVDPSFPISDATFKAEGIPIYHYAINSSEVTAPWNYFGFTHAGIHDPTEWDTKYGGVVNGVITDPVKRNRYSPKKVSKIFSGRGPAGKNWRFSPSDEWLVADAFRRPLEVKQAGAWPVADEPNCASFTNLPGSPWEQNREWGSLSNHVHGSGTAASAKVAPFQPYHIGGGFRKDPANGETVFKGKIGTLYFDGHVAAQNEWSGTKYWRRLLGTDVTVRD